MASYYLHVLKWTYTMVVENAFGVPWSLLHLSMNISGNLIHLPARTAQGGGGSFKDREPIGGVGCCDAWMAHPPPMDRDRQAVFQYRNTTLDSAVRREYCCAIAIRSFSMLWNVKEPLQLPLWLFINHGAMPRRRRRRRAKVAPVFARTGPH